jgi:hypothetical protein
VPQLEALGHQVRLTLKSRARRWPSDASPPSTLLLRRMMQARPEAARSWFSISLQAQIKAFPPPPRPYWRIEPRLGRHLARRMTTGRPAEARSVSRARGRAIETNAVPRSC